MNTALTFSMPLRTVAICFSMDGDVNKCQRVGKYKDIDNIS